MRLLPLMAPFVFFLQVSGFPGRCGGRGRAVVYGDGIED